MIEAGKKALDTHGAGLSSVRFICGTMVSEIPNRLYGHMVFNPLPHNTAF